MDSDYLSGSRGAANAPTTAHKVIGTLNLIFASLLLLCGACTGVSLMMQMAMAPMTENLQGSMQQSVNAQFKQEREQNIARLKEQAEAATDEEERAQFESEIDTIEQTEIPEFPKIDMMAAYRNPQIVGFMWTDFGSAVVLNILWFVSGLGLLASKAWARKLAIWTAALKIIRLIALYGYGLAVVVPIYSKIMSDMMEQVVTSMPQRPGQPAMPPIGPTMGTFYGVAMSAGAVLMIIVGSIYPIIVLWVLSRPKVKAACGELPASPPAGLP